MSSWVELLLFVSCICLCLLGFRWHSPFLILVCGAVVTWLLLESDDPL